MSNGKYCRSFTEKDIAHIEESNVVFAEPARVEGAVLVIDSSPKTLDYKTKAASAVYTADGFCDLVKRNCDITKPDITFHSHPEMYLALAGLSCEIYMKAIIFFEEQSAEQIRNHDLLQLFKKLPQQVKEEITAKLNNIEEVLSKIGNLFVTLRYNFEQIHLEGDYLTVFELMEALKIIAHQYPQENPGVISGANGTLSIE